MINYRMRLNQILGNPSVIVRCNDLGPFMDLCSVDELKTYFQLIVDNIYGFPSYPGWGIRRLTRSAQPKETEAILKFLGPEGPLFKAIYRLMTDRTFRLEFPVSSLPTVLDQRITRLDIPEFFTKKVQLVYDSFGQVAAVRNIFLNPFEYYFFMFAYANLGIGANQNYLIGWGSLNDTLYTNLLDDYNNYFFPCDGRGVPPISTSPGRPQIESTFNTEPVIQNNRSSITTPTRHDAPHPTLFRASVFQESANVAAAAARDTTFSPSTYSYMDLWRSETILNIFMETWMSVDCNDTQSSLPSVDVVKSVRIIVRHQHFFANCLNQQSLHPMEGLKRTLLPAYQKKLYVFLRHLFNRWPLDNTFRIVYETWLSYIQPWRYAKMDRFRQFRDKEVTLIEPIWFGFLVDNILFYTVLFQQMLPRYLRADLTSSKNALMLFRASKVFTAQDNMKTVLMEIEQMVVRYIQSPEDHPIGGVFHGSSYHSGNLMPDSCNSMEYCTPSRLANIKQMLVELEPPGFTYKALFSDDTKNLVKSLVLAINQAIQAVDETTEVAAEPMKTQNSILKLLGGADSSWSLGRSEVNIPASEKAKIAQLLDFSRQQLVFLFDLYNLDIQPKDNLHDSSGHWDGYSNGSFVHQDDSVHLTPGKFSASIASSLTPKGTYTESMVTPKGNPDLVHIRHNEVGWIVRLLILLSGQLNKRFIYKIQQNYYEPTLKGRLCRGIFSPPILYHVIEKVAPGRQIKNVRYLSPRVNLRPLGSFPYVFLFVFLILVSYIYGFSPVWFIFLGFVCFSAKVGICALLEKQDSLDHLITKFSPYIYNENDDIDSD